MPKKGLSIGDEQLVFDLFQFLSEAPAKRAPLPGSLNLDIIVREQVSSSLKKTTLDRIGVAAAMSRLVGREISKSMLDCYSSESKINHRLPAAFVNAFCEATGDQSLLRAICEAAGGFFVTGKTALSLSLLNLTGQRKEILKKEKIIRELISNLQGESQARKEGESSAK